MRFGITPNRTALVAAIEGDVEHGPVMTRQSMGTAAKKGSAADILASLMAKARSRLKNASPEMETARAGLPIRAFADAAAWETWLSAQPRSSPGVWLKLAKKSAGAATVSKPEAIDAALCHGWIDGQLDRFDEQWWLIRFTPRKARSAWSANNRRRAEELLAEGRIAPAGLAEIDAAKADGRWATAYESQGKMDVPDDLSTALAANAEARAFFDTLTGANRYAILYRIHQAKKPETRAARIAAFVAMCARGETLH